MVAIGINKDLAEQVEKDAQILAENNIQLVRETGDWSEIPSETIRQLSAELIPCRNFIYRRE